MLLPFVTIYTTNDPYTSAIVDTTKTDYAVLGISFLSAECCLVPSAAYHLTDFGSCYASQYRLLADLFGIVVVTAGTFVSGIYYAFTCEPNLQILHWTIVGRIHSSST